MRLFFKRGLIAVILLCIVSSLSFAEILPPAVQSAINRAKFKRSDIAIYIKLAGKNRVVASLNIDKEMLPASVIKVYSTYASLLELGYDYRWPTKFYAAGKLKNGTLYGDLFVKGYGDPTLRTADIAPIVSALKAKGIRKITGDIVIDRSYFTVPGRDSSHFDKNIYSAYNAMPDALMFNQHISKFTISVKNGRHRVTKSIPGKSYRVVNKIKSVHKSCRGRRSWPSISVNHGGATPVLSVSGALSTKCPARSYSYIITKPYKEFYEALRRQLGRSGIAYHGRMRVGRVPPGSKILYTHYSATLEKIISITAKKSNNLFARHLLLTLGAKIYGAPANLDKGRRAVAQILNRYRLLDTPRCHIDNGCGLSRVSKITARSMERVLEHARKSYGKRWMRTLSIAGTDGTIRRRFRNTSVKNRAWMKTGTLNNAKNIVGYVKGRSGKLYIVVILTNGRRARWHGAGMQNEIIKWLVGYSGSGVPGGRDPMREELKLKDKVIWGEFKPGEPHATSLKGSSVSTGSYYIQVGSFGSAPDEAFLKRLRNGGFAFRVVEAEGRHKVLVGPYADHLQADSVLSKLQEITPGAYVTRL